MIYSFARDLGYEDLPAKGRRWTPRAKALAVSLVWSGRVTRDALCDDHEITSEEFALWEQLMARHGLGALRATHARSYRHETAILRVRPAKPRKRPR
ncbi:DUF1153 domain-containing protein [Phenylobacterium sp.]|uniref:DUF1153 domain-containing protein n=1 Tax=Phenylobacterium sp. TaxID=1871053 RepID=UPI0035B4AB79